MTIDYLYKKEQNKATTGYFSCEPQGLSLEEKLQALRINPNDSFLHLNILISLREKGVDELKDLVGKVYDKSLNTYVDPTLAALLLECAYLYSEHQALKALFPKDALEKLSWQSPLIYLRELASFKPLDFWPRLDGSIQKHESLDSELKVKILANFASKDLEDWLNHLSSLDGLLANLHETYKTKEIPGIKVLPPNELYREAVSILLEADLLEGAEMRHVSSLAPIALLRDFKIDLKVQDGTIDYRLKGKATAYGRGFSLLQARVSYVMEIIERASVYVSLENKGGELIIYDRAHPLELVRGSFDSLCSRYNLLPKVALDLDPKFNSIPLTFVKGETSLGEEIFVPLQLVLLFGNLNEPEIRQAIGSTGLASGSTLAQAKVHALCEIIERDAEAISPFNLKRCFRLKSHDPKIQGLLDDYLARGISVYFQDLTWELGVPVYQAFLYDEEGVVVRASAANLSGARAILSALTETPWPYDASQAAPYGKPSSHALDNLPWRYLEDLPN
ncbi:MAG: YcaO-like family protein, partial [Desulfovibrionaceae bacterium]|nr:YcaO-like family protein [Desulfovibrionaceae bacterium]